MISKSYSMVKFLQRLYAAITILFLAILIAFNIYSLTTVKKQYEDSRQQLLNLYFQEVDNSLSKISSSLLMHQIQGDFPSFRNLDSQEIYYVKKKISSTLSSAIIFFDYCDGLFLYDYECDQYTYVYASELGQQQTYNTRLQIPNVILSIMKEQSLDISSGWYLSQLDGQDYLFYLQWAEGTCYGSWVNANRLLPPVSTLSSQPGTILQLKNHNNNQTISVSDSTITSGKDFSDSGYSAAAKADSSVAPLSLGMYTPGGNYLNTMNTTLRILILVSLATLITIPITAIILKRIVKHPLNQVISSISHYQSGDLTYKPDDINMPIEIIQVNHALTNMSHEIQTLKIDVYEKQLHLKDIQLQYLQQQIKPHFVINILNSVSLMAQMKENSKIVAVVNYLSVYMRNMMNLNIRNAPLSSELKQLENYLHLQEMRYPEQVTVNYHIDSKLSDFPIPVLTLQTLVENIFKHALEAYTHLTIDICAFIQDKEVLLRVRDNGCGFPKELLIFFKEHPEDIGDGQHIGLINIRQRLNLEYPGGASMTLLNDSGALVEITLPYKPLITDT